MTFKKISFLVVIFFIITKIAVADSSQHQYNFFVGNFDFSDDNQAALLVGVQHQNEDLNRDTILGNLSPIKGKRLKKVGNH